MNEDPKPLSRTEDASKLVSGMTDAKLEEVIVTEPSAIDRGISRWLNELHNTRVSADTEAWNALQNAVPALSKLINEEMKS